MSKKNVDIVFTTLNATRMGGPVRDRVYSVLVHPASGGQYYTMVKLAAELCLQS